MISGLSKLVEGDKGIILVVEIWGNPDHDILISGLRKLKVHFILLGLRG
jgi:hypothetical protein